MAVHLPLLHEAPEHGGVFVFMARINFCNAEKPSST